MREESRKSILSEEVGTRRVLVIGAIAAVIVVGGVIFALLTLRNEELHRPRQAEILAASNRGRPDHSPPGRRNDPRGRLGPLSTPDGGWPAEPRSLEQMDEIPEGVLQQGSLGAHTVEDETPAGDVHLSAFYIDRYEVTNEQFQRCVTAAVCRPTKQVEAERFGAPRQPVVEVTWHDATTFCLWAGKRLPTEAEWERAARGNDRRRFPWGDDSPRCELTIYTACDRYGPAEVGGRPDGAGPFGTQDLSGNVWEWVQDWYAPRYYPADPEGAPAGPPAGRQRVLRGGSWHFGPDYIRAANRHRDDPESRTPWYGFRCAWSPPRPEPPEPHVSGVQTDASPSEMVQPVIPTLPHSRDAGPDVSTTTNVDDAAGSPARQDTPEAPSSREAEPPIL